MAEIDPLVFKLIADTKAARAEVKAFQAATGQGFSRVERDVLRLEAQMKRSTGAIGCHLRGLAGSIGTYFTGRELVGMIDSFTRLQNSLKVAGLEGANLESVQSKLLDLSSRYGVSVNELANLYGKATDAGRSFGASEAQVLQLTEATSQALKITGTNAAQASGAILGLSQALASGTVRAEEYNQINEGGLRPLLQAAAGAERFGGDINKLRAAMLDGKVSSKEFFDGIIAGAAGLEGKASKATLTLSGAFEALTSRLTVYIGQSAEANGVTGALAGAMQLLADNLDIIIPALATIGALLGTTLAFNAIAGSRAFFALTAAIGGAATTAEAAKFAFGGLGAVLSGPAGIALAVTAVGAGLYYLASSSERAEASIKDLTTANDAASAELDGMISRLKAAGIETDDLAAAAARAKGPIDDLADAYRQALIEARRFNQGTAAGDVQEQNKIITASQARQAELRSDLAGARRNKRNTNARFGNVPGALDTDIENITRELEQEVRSERLARARLATVTKGAQAGIDLTKPDSQSAAPSKPSTPKSTRSARTARDPLDDEFRNAQELRQLQLEEIRAKEQAAVSAATKAEYAREALVLEATIRRKDIEEQVRKKQLTQTEADARLKIIDNLYGAADEITVQGRETAYQMAITREEQERLARQQADALRDELDALGAEADVTDTRKARVAIERRMLELQQEIERRLLDEAIARGDVADVAAARAALGRKQTADTAAFDKNNMGPLGQYLEDLRVAGLNLDDQFESIAVNGLQRMTDGLADAIANSKSLGDVFKNVAKQIIADLIRIAIQQTIVNGLMSSLGLRNDSGGGGGGSFISNILGGVKALGKTPGGLVSGGYAAPHSVHRVNEQGGGVELLSMGSRGGMVIPLGAVNAQAARPSAQSNGTVRIIVEEGPNFMSTIRAEAVGVGLEIHRATLGQTVELAKQATLGALSRPNI